MKSIAIIVVVLVALWGATIWYNVLISGDYYLIAPWYETAFMVIVLLAGIYVTFKICKWILKTDFKSVLVILPIGFALLMASCNYVKSNQKVVYSTDCGVNWKEVPMGERVPTGNTNPCYIKETMPGYEMQGEMDFYVLFKDQVKVRIRLTYSYLIENPLLFMKVAKKLGKANADADDAQDDNDRFEGAENRVIETRIKTITSDEFPKEDVVSHDINALEVKYVDLVNAQLKDRGVRITVFEMVPDFQPLTQQAIDAANADRIYTSKGMQEFGRQITLARSGATQIIVNDKADVAEKSDK